jgi:hypothetical protein
MSQPLIFGEGEMRNNLLVVAFFALIGSASCALAQDFADIKGKWTGKTEAVALGTPVHTKNPNPNPKDPGLSESDVTLTITGQKGRRFWGTFASAAGSEPIIGIFSRPGQFVFIDRDGYTNGTVRPDGTIEWIYQRAGDTMVAAHVTLKRE